MVFPRAKFLFGIHLTPLKTSNVRINVGLPRRGPKESDAAWGLVAEDLLDLLERFLRSLGEQEEDVDEHSGTEDREDDVDLPSDVCKCGRHEVCKGEVEGPVCRGGERYSLSSDAKRVELGWVDPGYWSPCGRI